MKINKNKEKSISTDAKLEFYSVLAEIRDLYQNHGYLKQKSLYEKMKEKYNWQMRYQSFSNYFNKEIKIQNPKKTNEYVEKNPQHTIKEQENEQVCTPMKHKGEAGVDKEVYERFMKARANLMPGIEAHFKSIEESKEEQENEQNNPNT